MRILIWIFGIMLTAFASAEIILMVLRHIYRYTIFGYYEIANVVTAVVVLIALGVASAVNGHISVDFLSIAQNDTYKKYLEYLVQTLMVIMFSSIGYGLFSIAVQEFYDGSCTFAYGTPLWILNIFVFLLIMLSMALTIYYNVVRKNSNNITNLKN